MVRQKIHPGLSTCYLAVCRFVGFGLWSAFSRADTVVPTSQALESAPCLDQPFDALKGQLHLILEHLIRSKKI
jgi:hypothetical protein